MLLGPAATNRSVVEHFSAQIMTVHADIIRYAQECRARLRDLHSIDSSLQLAVKSFTVSVKMALVDLRMQRLFLNAKRKLESVGVEVEVAQLGDLLKEL